MSGNGEVVVFISVSCYFCSLFSCFILFLAVSVTLKGKLQKVTLHDAPAVEDLKLHHFIGRMKGIQGHQNSCYLDATLFAMFGATNRFDVVIYEDPVDDTAKGVLDTMCEEIVFPLRRYVQSVAVILFFKVCSIFLTWLWCDGNPHTVNLLKIWNSIFAKSYNLAWKWSKNMNLSWTLKFRNVLYFQQCTVINRHCVIPTYIHLGTST